MIRPTGRELDTLEGSSLWSNRDYVKYWHSRAVSVAGSQVTFVALPLFALDAFEASRAAVVTVCVYASAILFAVPSGALADRYNRKRLMIGAEVLQALVMLGLLQQSLTESPTLLIVCFLALVNSGLYNVHSSAANAALPDLVSSRHFALAMARNQSRDFMLAIVGLTAGAWLYTTYAAIPFAVNSATFVLAACLMASIRSVLDVGGSGIRRLSMAEAGGGFRLVVADRPLRQGVLFLTSQGLILSAAFFAIILVYQQAEQPLTAGVMLAAQAAGGFVGSLLVTRLHRTVGGVRLLAAQGLLWGAGLCAIGLWPMPAWSVAAMFIMWLIVPVTRVVIQAHIKQVVAPGERGRVQSVQLLSQGVASPLGPLLVGLLAVSVVASTILLILGVLAIVFTLLIVVLAYALRPYHFEKDEQPG